MIIPCRELMPVIRAALERGQRVRMTVTGSSMLPFIRDGDTVELESVRSLPALGDIVLAQSPVPVQRYMLHRVVRVDDEGFYLCGDAQEQWEGPFSRHDALGRAVATYRSGCRRALDSGPWRLAGVVWSSCGPLGRRLLSLAASVRARGRGMLRRLRHALFFRA